MHSSVIWIVSSRSVLVFSIIDDREVIYPYFCIQLFKQCVNIAFQCVLVYVIERKIVLANDVCSRPPITIRFHNLHASNIRGAMGEITSYHERD